MTLYDINKDLRDSIDEETGEILDVDLFERLQVDRDEKLCNIALLAKNKKAEIEMIKGEEEKLRKKRKAAENTLAWCRETLFDEVPDGQKLKDPCGRFTVYHGETTEVRITDIDAIPKEWVREPTAAERERLINKVGLKEALWKRGEKIPGVAIKLSQYVVVR